MKTKKELKNQKAITLIALVITIVVLLILAGVTIATLTGDNGILTRASDAKIETAVGAVKEALKLEQGEKRINEEELTPETLLAEGKVQRTVQQGEDGNYYMYYALKNNAIEGMQGLGKGNIVELKDVFLIDDDLNVKYIATNGKEYGDTINNKILEDETEIRFASKAFSEYVSKISGVTEEEMKFKWMKNQTSLTIADSSIDSLQDLVFFPNLTSLTLGDGTKNNMSQLISLNGIENCIKLENLELFATNIEDFSGLASLKQIVKIYLLYGDNNIENLINTIKDFSKIKEFNSNYAGGNYDYRIIEKLPISLTSLTIRGAKDKIDRIDGIEKFTNLTYLQLDNNKIKTITELEKLTDLKTLNLMNNQIEDISILSSNINLMSLDLRGNEGIKGNREDYTEDEIKSLDKIGEILDKGGTINIDVDKLGLFSNYRTLNLSNQNLTTLEPLEGLTQLESLRLSSNQLTLEDTKSQEILQHMTNLKSLYLNYNKITNIVAINSLKNLTTLHLTGDNNKVNLKEIEDIISNLTSCSVSNDSLKTIINCDINKITTLNLAGSTLTEIPDLSKFTKLTKLDLRGISSIDNFSTISKIVSLENLGLSNVNLHGRMIDFSRLTNLTNLNLSGNTLWSEDLENLKALKNNNNLTIDLSNNSIIDATALLELNPNTKINLSGNINLSADSINALKAHFGSNVTF